MVMDVILNSNFLQRMVGASLTCGERNKRCEELCLENLLDRDDADLLNKWLSLFVMEVCKVDGSRYPPASILCVGYSATCVGTTPRRSTYLTSMMCAFEVCRTMELVYQTLHQKGVTPQVTRKIVHAMLHPK